MVVLSAVLTGQSKSPRLVTVTPDTGKADAEYAAAGENLAKDAVKEL